MNPKKTHGLRLFNNYLTIVVIGLALYVLLLPFLPSLTWWTGHEAPLISKPATAATPAASSPEAPQENSLVIPSIGFTGDIHEGTSAKTLRQGLWHIPKTSSPDKGGNTVIAGHRYTYSGAGVLYHLDKVKIGDPIVVYWDHKKYDYTVNNILAVLPTDGSVQSPTKDARLTVYTCTPLFSFTHRLIVQAKLESKS